MEADDLDSEVVQDCLERYRSGDKNGFDELVSRALTRLHALAIRLLRGFPVLAGSVDADDVVHEAVLRLMTSLCQVNAKSRRELYGLAVEHMRRTLVDLARRARLKPRIVARSASRTPNQAGLVTPEPASPGPDVAEMEELSRFHELLQALPVQERETLALLLYHGWSQADAAALFGVSIRTMQRWRDSGISNIQRRLQSGD